MDQCTATRKDGSRCTLRAIDGGYCFAHRPGAAESRRKGGRSKSNTARAAKRLPPKLQQLSELVAVAMAKVYKGDLQPSQGSAMAALAGAYVRLVTAGDFEERLAALEKRAGIA